MSKSMNENVVGSRIGAFVVDVLIFLVLFIVLSFITGGVDTTDKGLHAHLEGVPFFAFIFIIFVYYTVMEKELGGTAGKLYLNIRVVNSYGEGISYKESILRNTMRVVDAFPYFLPYCLGIVSVASSPTKQRLGDRLAKTYVVRPPKADARHKS